MAKCEYCQLRWLGHCSTTVEPSRRLNILGADVGHSILKRSIIQTEVDCDGFSL